MLAPEVAQARAQGTPIVALESTIIAHGFAMPDNLALARELEATVRRAGAVPATIAVVQGVIKIGLTEPELTALAHDGASFAKAGATDLAVYLARGASAATTVSATAMLAAQAGIRVFATGGIGGVHRGDADDVSHDLPAMAKHPVAIISAGAKAILDLPRTLERLETLGVLTVGYRTSDFPAFYTRSSGLPVPHRIDDLAGLAATAQQHWALGGAGILVCNPLPEADALPEAEIAAHIQAALAAANTAQISGKALTPFLLARLATQTHGASVRANRALALANARLGAELACALGAL